MSAPAKFEELELKPELLGNLTEIGYLEMTLVQARTLPHVIAGNDVLARAKTGSGKTAAFGLGLLNSLDPASFRTQALVLCPTRELADQVAKELRRLARGIANTKILTLCGGAPFGPQVASLHRAPHVVVGTPGRILKHLGKETLSLGDVKTFVLDEADRMLDMGFTDQINSVIKKLPRDRQTLLFSATYPDSIAAVSRRIQREPVTVDVTDDELPADIDQYWCEVTRDNRREALVSALRQWGGALNLVFCNTKIDCAEVAAFLQTQDIGAVALHGDLEQRERNEVLVRFSSGSASVLIATDVAARGLDVDALDAVFNYELPKQTEVYVHRIGRTGRAGRRGVAVSLVEARESRRFRAVEALMPDTEIRQFYSHESDGTGASLIPTMTTIQIDGGRKSKLRPGDLLGALTAEGGVAGEDVGSIDLFDTIGYVAVRSDQAKTALRQLSTRPIKGRRYRARILR